MAGEPYITVIGNLAGDPELRFTANGHAVANFTIAQTPRTRHPQSGEYVDDETLWVRASVWREAAENVAETLTKGMRVVAHGRLRARSFETKDGQQRTNWELDVDEIGPSLRWATAQVNRAPQQQPQQQQGGWQHPQAPGAQMSGYSAPTASDNAWSGGFHQPQQGQPPF